MRGCFVSAGIPVYRMSPKRTPEAQEIYDGVPSLHDAKASYLIARLHLDGASQPWDEHSPARREWKAMMAEHPLYQDSYQRDLNRLEAQLSRYWPEVLGLLGLGSVTLATLIATYGSPGAVAAHREEAAELMRRTGRAGLDAGKVEQVVDSAERTLGVPCIEQEGHYLKALAHEILHHYRGMEQVRGRLNSASRRTR